LQRGAIDLIRRDLTGSQPTGELLIQARRCDATEQRYAAFWRRHCVSLYSRGLTDRSSAGAARQFTSRGLHAHPTTEAQREVQAERLGTLSADRVTCKPLLARSPAPYFGAR
jgi:hypothetical protein